MAIGYNPAIVTNGLVLCLDAANVKSYPGTGTTLFDLSGNSRNGTLTNGTIYNSSNGGSMSFDGVNDTINFEYDLRSTWTYECWALHNVVNGFSFLGQGTTTANNGLHIWFRTDSIVRFGMFGNDTDSGTLATSTGVWYHYVFTYNHSTFQKQIYRNSVLSAQATNTQYTGTGTVRIGATYSSGGAYANGTMTGCKLYNRVLSATEIQQNFNALRGRFGV
jgi:hypothetical protein